MRGGATSSRKLPKSGAHCHPQRSRTREDAELSPLLLPLPSDPSSVHRQKWTQQQQQQQCIASSSSRLASLLIQGEPALPLPSAAPRLPSSLLKIRSPYSPNKAACRESLQRCSNAASLPSIPHMHDAEPAATSFRTYSDSDTISSVSVSSSGGNGAKEYNRETAAFKVTSPFTCLPRTRVPRLPLGPIQNSLRSNNSDAMSLSFSLGLKRGVRHKEAQLYRILHNRLLQWRFVNAQTESTISTQRHAAEKSLHSMWAKTLELQATVSNKCIKLQQAHQACKLNVILSAQDSKLQSWCNLQQDHHIGLSRVVDALEAAVLRIPVTPGVRVDIKPLKEAMKSAVEVTNSLGSVIAFLLPKAEKMDGLVSKLTKVAGQERALLEQCGELRAIASLYEVEERCLRAHLIQADKEKDCVLGCGLLESNVASLN